MVVEGDLSHALRVAGEFTAHIQEVSDGEAKVTGVNVHETYIGLTTIVPAEPAPDDDDIPF